MIDLYYWPTPNGHKITLFLEEAGLDYRIQPVNIGKGAQFEPDYLRISPNNKMPAIIDHAPSDGGEPISVFESGAILEYLADKTGRFIPADLRGRMTTLEWLYWQMGGLGPMAVPGFLFLAALSGSGPATVAAIGGLMIPAMLAANYSKGLASGIIASAGSIGVIIPPSIPMVIYCVSTGSSVGTLFIAGVIPGLMIGFALMAMTYFHAKKNGLKGEPDTLTGREKLMIVVKAFWALMIPVIILGGIYGQVFTPTEAAAVAVIYGAFVGVFIYRDLSWSDLPRILRQSALTSATVMVILGTASTFGRILTLEHIPVTLANAMMDISSNWIVILLLIQVLLLIVGCFMETLAAIIILAPILFPIITKIGIDPIHFGILMVVNLAIGFITPPLGVNLFVTCGIAKISLEQISKAIIPWVILMVGILMILTFFPWFSLVLPRMFGMM